MCAIFGAVITANEQLDCNEGNRILNFIMRKSINRGRDGYGYTVLEGIDNKTYVYSSRTPVRFHSDSLQADPFTRLDKPYMPASGLVLGNFRAEPTTEFVLHKTEHDQQPYSVGAWSIVHNGTIANDAELRTNHYPSTIDSAAIVEQLDHRSLAGESLVQAFSGMVRRLKGSFAILAANEGLPGSMFVAANYRPIWYARNKQGTFFASSRDYFPADLTPVMIEPYSSWIFTPQGETQLSGPEVRAPRVLVVCSGGLDSVVAATELINQGHDVHLLHFNYGSRAEGPEMKAIHAIGQRLDVPLHVLPMNIYSPSDSPLLQSDSVIAGGEAGAEFAHEWVPARNLVMLALATAYAEANGFNMIALGNNLEEAGAYPDNEPEFINRFNDLLPFAVGAGKRVRVVMPVGNLMKHEIVALGHEIGAPMDLTWSCYRAGEKHCGTCGPCFMRRTAFEINGLEEVIEYIGG